MTTDPERPGLAGPSGPSQRSGSSLRRYARWLVGLLALLAIVYFGVGAVIALRLTRPARNFNPTNTPAREHLTYKDVRFPARGNDAEIAAYYVPHAAGRWALVVVHGKDSSRTNQFRGRMPELLGRLYRHGYALLAIDLRGHGESSNGRLSFGINEHRDVLGAVDWLRAQGYRSGSIGLLGVSMGGAASIMAAAREPAIGAVVSDCAYADVAPIARAKFTEATGLPGLFLTPARLLGRLVDGYDILGARPVAQVAQLAPRPLLLIHGGNDQFTPVTHAYALHAAYPQSTLWVVPGADHAASFAADPQAYADRVAAFFANGLAN
jgi:pimeloyl-ACP methyl ester carboxylesterase